MEPMWLTLAIAGIVASSSVPWIGYTEYRTNLPGGRYANVATMRACVVRADGRGRKALCPELAAPLGAWTQFAGWSPDGRTAIIGSGWESAGNAAWEEAHGTFRFDEGAWRYDTLLVDMATGVATNVTAVDRVSHYNSGVFYWPDDPTRLGFTALIGGESHPFSMDLDGRHKTDLSGGVAGFTYGFSASPGGHRIAYHRDYQVFLADADGGNAARVDTGNPFNFAPQWSPDGRWLAFVSGEHYDCHPYIVRADGTGLRKLADRGGFEGVVAFLDVPDFHGGSSDTIAWSADSRWVYYSAQIDGAVELMRVSRDGTVFRLTHSEPGVLSYHCRVSCDGAFIVYGSTRTGRRQLYVAAPDGSDARAITDVGPGWGAMWACVQPTRPH